MVEFALDFIRRAEHGDWGALRRGVIRKPELGRQQLECRIVRRFGHAEQEQSAEFHFRRIAPALTHELMQNGDPLLQGWQVKLNGRDRIINEIFTITGRRNDVEDGRFARGNL